MNARAANADCFQARFLSCFLLRWRSRRTGSRACGTRKLYGKVLVDVWLTAAILDGLKSGVSNRSSVIIKTTYWRRGMTSSLTEIAVPAATNVVVTDDTLTVDLSDGRTISVPLAWYPRLIHGTLEERSDWRLIGRGEGIHWPRLDEDISVEGLIAGRPSGESQRSLARWIEARGGQIR